MLLFKGLKNLDMSVSTVGGLLIMAMIGAAVWASMSSGTRRWATSCSIRASSRGSRP